MVQQSEPGEEAEIDFGFAGLFPRASYSSPFSSQSCPPSSYTPLAPSLVPPHLLVSPSKQKVWIFVMTLAHSRYSYYEAVTDQRIETFIKCHVHAFEYFGGVPRSVKIDNLKAAIVRNTRYTVEITREYLDFSLHYGFVVKACTPFSPWEKGKVEAGVKYVKRNFLAGRTYTDIADLRHQLRDWMINTANTRMHGTIRKVPVAVFTGEERQALTRLPTELFSFYAIFKRKVAVNAHVHFENNYYSVPSHLVGETVEIRRKDVLLHVYHQNRNTGHEQEVAVHTIASGQGTYITSPAHTPMKPVYATTAYQARYEEKMRGIGEYTHQFFKLIVARDPVWLKSVKYILHLETIYGNEKVEKATRRALAFHAVRPGVVKRILERGLENEEIEPQLLASAYPTHRTSHSASAHTSSHDCSLMPSSLTSPTVPTLTRDLSYYKEVT